jgi:hypothetical protein
MLPPFTTPRRTTLFNVMRAVTLALGARAGWLASGYLSGATDVRRYQVESATLAFAIVGALLLMLSSTDAADEAYTHEGWSGEWVGWCLLSLALYWPSLHIGLLSDDFVLIDRVEHHAFGFVQPELFRPLPMLVWGGLLTLHGGPAVLHALNILAHGLVAFLATRVAVPLVASRILSVAVGLLVLTFPAAVEAVSWTAGVFDVTATLLTLTTILVARHYGEPTAPSTRAALFGCAIAALLCKETAVVVPAIIGLDAWLTRRRSPALRTDAVLLALFFVAVGAARLTLASATVRQPLTKYMLQRWLFGTTAGLAVPWHTDITSLRPWIPLTGALIVLGVIALGFITRGTRTRSRAAIACAGWVLLGTLPTVTFFFVGPDLQGARYLYLPSVGYAMLLAVMAGGASPATLRFVGTGALIVLALLGTAGTRWHQSSWQRAAGVRDEVLSAARVNEQMRACHTVTIRDLPDIERGAYVFRNGAAVAFSTLGLTVSADTPAPCAFTWSAGDAAFVQPPR